LVDGVALGGYDAVSYFTDGGPKEGSEQFAADWKDARWRFSTAENLAAFKASPEKYAPQYGGYCAYAVSKGATAKGDPSVWTLANGKLYLNLSKEVQATWRNDIPGNVAQADANWPGVLK
ncbi:MAG: YHS domain-containing (seleno)protein, partial [Aestuariivirga sp.]